MLLEVQDLRITLATPQGPAEAVRGVDFELASGETLGLIGESGSGKSLTALALMGLLPEGARSAGRVLFEGQDLLALPERQLGALRGRRLAMVFQEPMTALNPLHPIGRQVAEPLRLHLGLGRHAAERRALALLERVGLPDAQRRMAAYPHELSGGQRQRVTIAMALACEPALLIADEPTTALDVTVQAQILDLLAELVDERRMALLLISHDLGVIAENVRAMLVMYGGLVVERGPSAALFRRMAHPYTQGLMAARPRLGATRGQALQAIPGSVPGLLEMPPGCPFAPRCRLATAECDAGLPPPLAADPGHEARCVHLTQALRDG
ncbi:MAG TPA: ABC transporter ATP-binding protein [Roseateles sp.]|nr:ABC transporter ATP-binding protein [Roseateles sp.]